MASVCFINSDSTHLFSTSPLSSPSSASQFLMRFLAFHYSLCISAIALKAIPFVSLFLPLPFTVCYFPIQMNSDELTAEDLITPLPFSYRYVAFPPSHFYSLLPLILLSSFPQHTMNLPLPNCLSAAVFHPLTSLSSLIFPQPFPCLYIRPSFSSLLDFCFSSTHTLPSIRLCVCGNVVCTCAIVCMCACFFSRA